MHTRGQLHVDTTGIYISIFYMGVPTDRGLPFCECREDFDFRFYRSREIKQTG